MPTLPLARPRSSGSSVLRAVIDQARRHARRRRTRNCAVILIAIALAAGVRASLDGGGSAVPAGNTPSRIDVAVTRPLAQNGGLALMTVKSNAQHEGPTGWYGISTLGSNGRLRTLIRCPGRARWCGDLESIDWSPEGTSLAFGVTSFGARNPYNGLHIVDFRSHQDRQLVRQGQFGEYDWFDIDWAPDGRKLAYATNGHVAVIDGDGTNRRVLETGTVGHDHSPSWSPDGRWIAFASRHDGHSSVYVIDADGSERRMVARYGATPAWSPDGSRIAFRGLDRIQYVSPNGRLLAPRIPVRPGAPVGINGAPVWSPDGRKIAMSNRLNGTWIMNVDGTALRQVSSHSGDAVDISHRPRPAWRPRP